MFKTIALAGALSLVATTSFGAVFTTFTDRTSFEAALSSFDVEDFNSVVGSPSFDLQEQTIGDITLRNSNPDKLGFVDQPPFDVPIFDVDGGRIPRFPVDDTAYLLLLTQGTTGSVATFTFASSITAFGAGFSGLNRDGLRNVFEVNGETITPPVQDGNTVQFFGFTSDMPFTTVTITSTVDFGEVFGADNVTYGTVAAIPLPAPALMLLTAVGGLSALRRARRA